VIRRSCRSILPRTLHEIAHRYTPYRLRGIDSPWPCHSVGCVTLGTWGMLHEVGHTAPALGWLLEQHQWRGPILEPCVCLQVPVAQQRAPHSTTHAPTHRRTCHRHPPPLAPGPRRSFISPGPWHSLKQPGARAAHTHTPPGTSACLWHFWHVRGCAIGGACVVKGGTPGARGFVSADRWGPVHHCSGGAFPRLL
jgi:hypothetical protein